MSEKNPSWDHFRSFLWVLRTGSLSAAGRHLRVRQSTIGRQIEALESELGVPLFTRSQVGLKPTTAAHRLRPHLEAIQQASDALIRNAKVEEDDLSGIIRLTTNETIAMEILPEILRVLSTRFPLIRFEISTSNDFKDLLAREADIAIRNGMTQQKAILIKKVGELEIGFFGTRDYLRGRKLPRSEEDLKDFHLIGYDQERTRAREVTKLDSLLSRSDFHFFSDNVTLHTRLVDASCGLGLCWVDPKRKDRIRILPSLYRVRFGTWIAMHENLRRQKKYRFVFSALSDLLKSQLL